MRFLHSVYGKAFSSLMMFKDIYMFGNDKTTFALFKAYEITCTMITYYGEGNKS